MQAALDELETGDNLRHYELNNLRQALQGAVEAVLDGDLHEYDEMMSLIAKRVNYLAENPAHAGNHEQFRKQ